MLSYNYFLHFSFYRSSVLCFLDSNFLCCHAYSLYLYSFINENKVPRKMQLDFISHKDELYDLQPACKPVPLWVAKSGRYDRLDM
jgi:hypothetical protein